LRTELQQQEIDVNLFEPPIPCSICPGVPMLPDLSPRFETASTVQRATGTERYLLFR
jgi:hypothetical protein